MSVDSSEIRSACRWSDAVYGRKARAGRLVLGVLPGEGIGPEVVDAALEVVRAALSAGRSDCDIRTGGAIGRDAELMTGRTLTDDVSAFCEGIFGEGGAVLSEASRRKGHGAAWRRLAPAGEQAVVPGDHESFLLEHGDDVGRVLSGWLGDGR